MATDAPLNRTDGVDRRALRLLGDRTRPVNLAGERQLPVVPALAGAFPGGGLPRGATVVSTGPGAMSLAMVVMAGPSAAGSWSAVVGIASFGLLAAAELGVSLERVVMVERPEPSRWATVVAALLDAFEVVVVRPEHRVTMADHRRLRARSRERGAVLVQAGGRADAWPEAPELRIGLVHEAWRGVGAGHGHLQARRVTVEVTGRRGADRARRATLWLPGTDGRPAPDSSSGLAVGPAVTRPVPTSNEPLREVG